MSIHSSYLGRIAAILIGLLMFHTPQAQGPYVTKDLPYIATIEGYEASVRENPDKRMISLKSVIPNIIYELRYASKNNFTNKRLYPKNTSHTFLRKQPALALARAAEELNSHGLKIKVWDAYRPHRTSIVFWELVKDENFVAHPSKGSFHNRGLAIDMTLVDSATGKELDFGTGFDNFTEVAHPDYPGLSAEAAANRKLLRGVMEKHGFVQFPTEWWHYSWPDDQRYENLNIDHEKLNKALNKN